MKTITIDKETQDDLIRIIDDRIHFITRNMYRNPIPLKEELERLQKLFDEVERL